MLEFRGTYFTTSSSMQRKKITIFIALFCTCRDNMVEK